MEEHKPSIKFLERIVYMQSYNLEDKMPKVFVKEDAYKESKNKKASKKSNLSSRSNTFKGFGFNKLPSFKSMFTHFGDSKPK